MFAKSCSFVLLCLTALPLAAATYVVPSDRALAARADAIVVATAGDSYAQQTADGGIETVTTFTVEEVVKGDRSMTTVEVHEPGGVFAGKGLSIPGVPHFQSGERLILFLARTPQQTWAVADIALGKFRIVRDLVTRADVVGWDIDGKPHVERPRFARGFLEFLRGSGSENYFTAADDAVPLKPATNAFPAATYTIDLGSGTGSRRDSFPAAVTYLSENTEPGAPGNGITAIQAAMAAWSGKGGSNVNIVYSATPTGGTGGLHTSDGQNTILFEQDLSSFGAAPFNCSSGGVLGIGGPWWSPSVTNTFGGATYFTITEGDVEMNKGIANCTALFSNGDFNTAVAHEVGHTLGFRHADQDRQDNVSCAGDPTIDCSGFAVMKSFIPNGINAALQTWDLSAVGSVYGSGAGCTPPSITAQPQSVTITSGQPATLSVAAAGTAPLTFQWFIGASGDTSNPIAGATGVQVSVSPTTTTNYWVQVSGACAPPANSTTATVTVNASCPAVTVTQPTATAQGGGSFSLAATASGGNGFTFQWFQGATSGSGTPVGTGNPLVVTPSVTTTYWVRVTNSCRSTADSATVTVTVGCPTVTVPAPSAVQQTNGGYLLNVNPAGGTTFTFQWFIGSAPGSGTPVGNGNPFFVNPTASTTYWVRVMNDCGNQTDSPTVTINVVGGCTPPSIIGQPQDQTVTSGGTVTLTVSFFGNNTVVTWYQGAPPDTSHPVGMGNTIVSPAITANTSFWAQIVNSCGTASTRAAQITVTASCTPPAITGAAASPATIASGQSATLSAAATGTSISFQWYRGSVGDTLNPVSGGNAASVTVSPAVTTSYWVQVTSGCGAAAANSGPVVVQVTCTPPSFTLPAAITIVSGESATIHLTVSGTQPVDVAWFRGQPGDTSHPVGTDSPTLSTGALTASTTFWARLTNGCGSADTSGITVTVKPERRRAVHH